MQRNQWFWHLGKAEKEDVAREIGYIPQLPELAIACGMHFSSDAQRVSDLGPLETLFRVYYIEMFMEENPIYKHYLTEFVKEGAHLRFLNVNNSIPNQEQEVILQPGQRAVDYILLALDQFRQKKEAMAAPLAAEVSASESLIPKPSYSNQARLDLLNDVIGQLPILKKITDPKKVSIADALEALKTFDKIKKALAVIKPSEDSLSKLCIKGFHLNDDSPYVNVEKRFEKLVEDACKKFIDYVSKAQKGVSGWLGNLQLKFNQKQTIDPNDITTLTDQLKKFLTYSVGIEDYFELMARFRAAEDPIEKDTLYSQDDVKKIFHQLYDQFIQLIKGVIALHNPELDDHNIIKPLSSPCVDKQQINKCFEELKQFAKDYPEFSNIKPKKTAFDFTPHRETEYYEKIFKEAKAQQQHQDKGYDQRFFYSEHHHKTHHTDEERFKEKLPPSEKLEEEKALEYFGFKKNDTPDEKAIKRKFNILALTKHPDKGGDTEEFKQLRKFFELLTESAQKRAQGVRPSPPKPTSS